MYIICQISVSFPILFGENPLTSNSLILVIPDKNGIQIIDLLIP